MCAAFAVRGLVRIDPRVGCVGDDPDSHNLAWSVDSNIG
jgi:hypothetical protein